MKRSFVLLTLVVLILSLSTIASAQLGGGGNIVIVDKNGVQQGTQANPLQVNCTGCSAASNVGITGQPISVSCTPTNCPGGGPALAAQSVPIVFSYEPEVQGVTASVMTTTASTQVIPGVASNYMYIDHCSIGNSSGSVGTFVDLTDGSGGTVLQKVAAGTNFGGESASYGSHPFHVPTLGNGLYAADETTGASVNVSCNGFVSPNKYF